MNGADLLCKTLLANDIDVCFANPGTSEMHFVSALDRQPRMRCILGLSEGVVTGAADGYARMADKPAATLLHLGPGLANGIANLHNARRAHSQMVNIVGDHATYHLSHDSPLTSDIESLARPVSQWLCRAETAESVGTVTVQAIIAAQERQGQIATMILHADAAWNTTDAKVPERAPPKTLAAPDDHLIALAVKMLTNGKRTMILVSGAALLEGPLSDLDRIAHATGAEVLASSPFARMQRGRGRPAFERTPYVADQALRVFNQVEQLILIGARKPVSFFAYPGKPNEQLPEGCEVLDLVSLDDDLPQAIDALRDALKIAPTAPMRKRSIRPVRDLPSGALTPTSLGIAISRYLPENAIICDESITSGREFYGFSFDAAPHDFLPLTGGAIGIGMPLAVGASVACPDRKVLSMQADGSGMYTVQALWTQAREHLDVVTVIFSNRKYQILHGELSNVGANAPGVNASRMLDLDNPALNWVHLANGMGVEAARAETVEEFTALLVSAFGRKGPFLIEAIM